MSPAASDATIWSVADLNREVRWLLEEEFDDVRVAGEISNCRRYPSGHVYLTLKDADAELAAVIWRGTAKSLRFEPKDGLDVLCRGRLTVYEVRGKYQLIIHEIEPRGTGALELAFRQLKEKLEKEGLFEPDRKKPLPFLPRRIGVVTSPTGAAIRDILRTIRRKFPPANVLVVPVPVQGDAAAPAIAAAIARLNRSKLVDVMIVGRGGGSLEDLWAFNEEAVARAVARSRIPVISAVGHETDVTISDLVADVREATPTAAGERVVPSAEEIDAEIASLDRGLRRTLRRRLDAARKDLDHLARHPMLYDPRAAVEIRRQTVDDLSGRIPGLLRRRLSTGRSDATALAGRLPHAARSRAALARERLTGAAGKLESLNPYAVLDRGYSITTGADGRVLRDAAAARQGDRIRTRLARGALESTVEKGGKG